MATFRLLIPVDKLSDNEQCCKPTGSVKMTVKRKIPIFGGEGCPAPPGLVAAEGTVFLVGPSGSISCVPGSSLVAVDFNEKELLETAKRLFEEYEIGRSK